MIIKIMESILQNIAEPVYKALDRYKNVPNIEIEGRLGIFDHDVKSFDTNIGEDYYNSILKLLESCKKWETQNNTHVTDFFNDKLRLSVDNETAKQFCIEKKKLEQFTFVNENGPLDFRITISKEDPVRVEKFPTKNRNTMKQREKKRKSFKLNNYNFDLTKILNKNSKNDIEEYYEYEVENTKNINSKHTIDSIILKLLDAIYSCEGFIKTDDNSLPTENLSIFLVK